MRIFLPVIKAIESLAKKAGKPKWEIEGDRSLGS